MCCSEAENGIHQGAGHQPLILVKVDGYQEGTLARSQPPPGLSEPAPPDKHGWLLTAGAKEIKPKAPWREDSSGLYALAHSNPPVCPFLSCWNITHLAGHRGTQPQPSKGPES